MRKLSHLYQTGWYKCAACACDLYHFCCFRSIAYIRLRDWVQFCLVNYHRSGILFCGRIINSTSLCVSCATSQTICSYKAQWHLYYIIHMSKSCLKQKSSSRCFKRTRVVCNKLPFTTRRWHVKIHLEKCALLTTFCTVNVSADWLMKIDNVLIQLLATCLTF